MKAKGIILHLDALAVLDELSDEQAARLFRAIRDYHRGVEPKLDTVGRIAFLPFLNQFRRDEEKYRALVERNRRNAGTKPTAKESPKAKTKAEVVVWSDEVESTFRECLREFPEDLHPDKPDGWLDAIDKLVRIDGVSHAEIVEIVKRARGDDFWSKNFLSLTKLRKKNGDGVHYWKYFRNLMRNGKERKDAGKIVEFALGREVDGRDPFAGGKLEQ